MKIYYNSDNKLTITVTDANGDPVVGATVNATLVDLQGIEISGQTWPVALNDESDGTYTVVLGSTIGVAPNQRVKCQVTAVSGVWDAYAEVPIQVMVDNT